MQTEGCDTCCHAAHEGMTDVEKICAFMLCGFCLFMRRERQFLGMDVYPHYESKEARP